MPILKHIEQYKILLDTHVLFWVVEGNPQLSKSFRKGLDLAAEHERVLISPLSFWEIGMLVEKRKIELEMDSLDWIEQILNQKGFVMAPMTPKMAILSTRLPGIIHGDPVDRILVATAHEESAVLVTHDKKLLEYGKVRLISVYDPL